MQVRSLGWEGPLEKGMATHSSILAWRIPRTEEHGNEMLSIQNYVALTFVLAFLDHRKALRRLHFGCIVIVFSFEDIKIDCFLSCQVHVFLVLLLSC